MAHRKQELEALRDELIDRFERYKAHKEQRGGPLDKDMEDQSIELQNDDVIEALQQEAEDELRQVMHALERIDNGEGDLCEECGEEHTGTPASVETFPGPDGGIELWFCDECTRHERGGR